MDTDKRINELADTRNWQELTSEEKAFVLKELGSEEAYHSLRGVNVSLENVKSHVSPQPKTLTILQQRMRESHGRERPSRLAFLFFKTPAYVSAFMILLAIFAGLSVGRRWSSRTVAVQTVYKTDTLRVSTPPDTVFLTRVIYRDRPAAQRPALSVANTEPAREESVTVGVSMKEKEELDNLLVSGSD